MAILIDGYNLLHVTGIFGRGRPSFQRSREALVEFLAAAIDPKEVPRTIVVFDAAQAPPGLPRSLKIAGISVQFAARDQSADQLLEELIRQAAAPRETTVVSSDHQVQRAAKRRKATAVDSDRWFAALVTEWRQRQRPEFADRKPSPPNSEAEVQWWIRQFGDIKIDESAEIGLSSMPRKPPGPMSREGNVDENQLPLSPQIDPDLANPFPPGYGHDVLDDESK